VHRDDKEREQWLNSRVDARHPEVLDELLAEADHPDPEIRSTVAYGLGEIEDVRAIEPLIRFVDRDADEKVRDEALRALDSYRDTRILECLIREVHRDKRSRPPRQVVARQLRHYPGDRTVAALAELVSDPDEFVRSDALESLLQLRPDLAETWNHLYLEA
jgi:HEAT repeat protein